MDARDAKYVGMPGIRMGGPGLGGKGGSGWSSGISGEVRRL